MSAPTRHRILIVDDEEAILETMSFTFEDEYDVLTSTDAAAALEILGEQGPVAVVLSDQRMPNMTGVEFLSQVYERHPTTVRMILTGFADMDAIIQAINDGHVYAYITKPWEPEQLKQVMRRAVDHHLLAVENVRLLGDLQRTNALLEAAMDQLDTGALAVDESGIVRAANRPAWHYLQLDADPRGQRLSQVLGDDRRSAIADAAARLATSEEDAFHDLDLDVGGRTLRLRVVVNRLAGPDESDLGQVILLREISHEPLRRRLEERVRDLTEGDSDLRARLEQAAKDLGGMAEEVRESGIESPGMSELRDLISRSLTAMENWLDVDGSLCNQDYPDAQLLTDRMRIGMGRWPFPDAVPERVRELARRVESYYETGENPKQPVL